MAIHHRTAVIGAFVAAVSFAVYLASNRLFDAGRGDLFYLAEAFLEGRTWLERALGPYDVVVIDSRIYVPFAPFPAILLMPLVAAIGAPAADRFEPVINAAIAAADVGLCWWLVGRAGVRSLADRAWLTVLFAFSTAIWWVTTRGGVWHTGHLVAMLLTFLALIEWFGRSRPLPMGLLGGAALLTRAPLLFALALYALRRETGIPPLAPRSWPWRSIVLVGLAAVPAVAFALWYNAVRFGTPFESGYGLAALPDWLDRQRDIGLFSLAHLPMNLDYLLVHLPSPIAEPPFFKPDALGLSIFLTSPGLLLAARADWRSPAVRALGLTALAVLVPNLLYYGGGWFQYGYRYALDAIPFVMAITGLAIADRRLTWPWMLAIAFGVVVNLVGVYWAYNL